MRVPLTRMTPRRRSLVALGDEELMVLVADHDADAFEVVYDRHGAAAYSLAYRTTGQQSLAEEVVQDAFMTVWRMGLRYRPERGSLRSWLLSIVYKPALHPPPPGAPPHPPRAVAP